MFRLALSALILRRWNRPARCRGKHPPGHAWKGGSRSGLAALQESATNRSRRALSGPNPSVPCLLSIRRLGVGMKQMEDFSDRRYKGICIHCGSAWASKPTSSDHVPTKALLDRPLPANVHVVEICVECNNGFARDEEYFVAFLGAAMAGSTNPEAQMFEAARNVLAGNTRLRREVEAAKKESIGAEGKPRLAWEPVLDRIRSVVVKNARGHVFYELGQPMFEEPCDVWFAPLAVVDKDRLADFLNVDMGPMWPEVGSRLLQRVVQGTDFVNGWIIVQPEVYVFAVIETAGVTVRSIIREYLLTEVTWR